MIGNNANKVSTRDTFLHIILNIRGEIIKHRKYNESSCSSHKVYETYYYWTDWVQSLTETNPLITKSELQHKNTVNHYLFFFAKDVTPIDTYIYHTLLLLIRCSKRDFMSILTYTLEKK